MYKFSTNTIVNSINWPGFANVPTANEGGESIEDHKRFWVDLTDTENPIFRVARHFKFPKKNVVAIYKRKYSKPQLFEVQFDMNAVIDRMKEEEQTSGVGRIVLYIGLSGSENSYYANASSYKGKPFIVEFKIKKDATAADVAKEAVKNANRHQQLIFDYKLVNIKADGDKVVMTGTDEYQVVRQALLQYYDEDAYTYDCCAQFGAFDTEDKGVIVTQGKAGFGTFRQMIKDLRLPTAANTNWTAIAQDDRPIPGGYYNEYVIKLCVNRGILGSDAVGEITKSLTNHVFYVLDSECGGVTEEWEKALSEAGLSDVLVVVDKDEDDVTLTEEEIDETYDDPEAVQEAEKKAHGSKTTNTGEDTDDEPDSTSTDTGSDDTGSDDTGSETTGD